MLILLFGLAACMQYHSPDHETWGNYLSGASFMEMTEMAQIAKKPIYLGAGGKLVSDKNAPVKIEYGDKTVNDNLVSLNYMSKLEYELYNALRKPGISVQRAGTDVVVILVRDALIEPSAPDISKTGVDTLRKIANVLKKYDATFIEIAGYTDAMKNKRAAGALSLDMAERVAVFLSQHDINTARMFIVGRGSSRPIAAQDDIGRLTNRRVELRLTPAR